MKQTITLLSIALGAISGHAQTEAPDSLSGQELQEIVIEAPKVIRKADMDVYHPSKSAVENSKNGMQLLNNLMIPSLNVSEALGSIQAAGQSVQIRINGRESTIDQVRALLPETIKRVEWIDNPGLRYGGANYVLNFIVSNPTVGGSFQGQARPALNQAWGFYMADAKFNVGRSQWEVYASCKLTEDIKIYRDYNETFTYPDGTSITRRETPRGGCLDNTLPYYFASYNYIKPDTTVFVAQFTNQQHSGNKTEYNGIMSYSNGDNDILLTERYGDKGNYPTLSLYLQQNFPRKQMLVVDLSASMYFGGHGLTIWNNCLTQTAILPTSIPTLKTVTRLMPSKRIISRTGAIRVSPPACLIPRIATVRNMKTLMEAYSIKDRTKCISLPNISTVSANGRLRQAWECNTPTSFSKSRTKAIIHGAPALKPPLHIH